MAFGKRSQIYFVLAVAVLFHGCFAVEFVAEPGQVFNVILADAPSPATSGSGPVSSVFPPPAPVTAPATTPTSAPAPTLTPSAVPTEAPTSFAPVSSVPAEGPAAESPNHNAAFGLGPLTSVVFGSLAVGLFLF